MPGGAGLCQAVPGYAKAVRSGPRYQNTGNSGRGGNDQDASEKGLGNWRGLGMVSEDWKKESGSDPDSSGERSFVSLWK